MPLTWFQQVWLNWFDLYMLYRVPALVTAILLISGEKLPDTIDPTFFYGKLQVII